MLRAKLRHDHDRHRLQTTPRDPVTPLYEDLKDGLDPVEVRIDGRTMDLQEAASRIVAKANPDMPRAERLDALDRIDAWIDQEVEEHPDFGTEVLDEHVLALCRALGLPEELGRRFRDLPRAPRDPEDDPDPRYNFEGKPDPGRRETG